MDLSLDSYLLWCLGRLLVFVVTCLVFCCGLVLLLVDLLCLGFGLPACLLRFGFDLVADLLTCCRSFDLCVWFCLYLV